MHLGHEVQALVLALFLIAKKTESAPASSHTELRVSAALTWRDDVGDDCTPLGMSCCLIPCLSETIYVSTSAVRLGCNRFTIEGFTL